MINKKVISSDVSARKQPFFYMRKIAAIAISMMSFMFILPGAMAEPEHEHVMNHANHGNTMEHSGHDHHMPDKSAGYTVSVESYIAPEVKLVDMNGSEISLRDLLNGSSPIAMNFIFTTCTAICPVMSATFQHVQKQLGNNRGKVRMISISIDPENDTPAKLKEYAKKYKAGPRWTMLTGTLENSIAIQRAFGVFAVDKMSHKPVTFLKAKGSENTWTRLDGLVDASDIIKELNKIKIK